MLIECIDTQNIKKLSQKIDSQNLETTILTYEIQYLLLLPY